MSEILLQYERVNPTSWAYLSSLLTLALFFKFGRPLCLRNLDLILVILLAAVLLVRALIDSSIVRRPLLESNLTAGGLTFLSVSLLAFLTANIITGRPGDTDLYAVQRAEYLSHREASELEENTLDTHGPGFTFLFLLPHISTRALTAEAPVETPPDEPAPIVKPDNPANVLTARVTAVICQGLIVAGILLIARRHIDLPAMGLAAVGLYLLLPYTIRSLCCRCGRPSTGGGGLRGSGSA